MSSLRAATAEGGGSPTASSDAEPLLGSRRVSSGANGGNGIDASFDSQSHDSALLQLQSGSGRAGYRIQFSRLDQPSAGCCGCCMRRGSPEVFCVWFCLVIYVFYLLMSSFYFWMPYTCPKFLAWVYHTDAGAKAVSAKCGWQLELCYIAIVHWLQFILAFVCQRCLVWFCRRKAVTGYLAVSQLCSPYVRAPFYASAFFTSCLAVAISLVMCFCPGSEQRCLGPLHQVHLVMLPLACEILAYSCLLLWLLGRIWRCSRRHSAPDVYLEDETSPPGLLVTTDSFQSSAAAGGGAGMRMLVTDAPGGLGPPAQQRQPQPDNSLDELLAKQAALIGHLRMRNSRLTRRVYRAEREWMRFQQQQHLVA